MPKVSIIIPLYNHEKYIQETIYSAINQTFSDFELIIINDGSTDRSEDIVKDIKDDRIVYIFQENQGAQNTINKGISLAKGEYISILNSDDSYYPERLKECISVIESNSSTSAVFSEVEFIDENGIFMQYLKAPEDNWDDFNIESFAGEKKIFLGLLTGNFLVSTSNLFCRKDIFDKIGIFSSFKYTHDYEFFLRLSSRCKVYFINSPLLKYRIHSTSSYKTNEAEVYFEVGIILKDVLLKYDLLKGNEDEIFFKLLKLFKLLNTSNTDRIIMSLFLLHIISPELAEKFTKHLIENPQHLFRLTCIEKIKTHLDLWKHSQAAWEKWKESNERLIAKEHELTLVNERLIAKEYELTLANERLNAKENELNVAQEKNNLLLNSYSFKLGSFLTYPIRKISKLIK